MNLDAEQMAKIMEFLGRLDERTAIMYKELLGGEQPGLKQRVENLEASRNRVWGGILTLTGLGGLVEWLIHRK